jgi:hypothetical protein
MDAASFFGITHPGSFARGFEPDHKSAYFVVSLPCNSCDVNCGNFIGRPAY